MQAAPWPPARDRGTMPRSRGRPEERRRSRPRRRRAAELDGAPGGAGSGAGGRARARRGRGRGPGLGGHAQRGRHGRRPGPAALQPLGLLPAAALRARRGRRRRARAAAPRAPAELGRRAQRDARAPRRAPLAAAPPLALDRRPRPVPAGGRQRGGRRALRAAAAGAGRMTAVASFSAAEQALLDDAARRIVGARMAVPAMMFLETLAPMNLVTASMLHALQPLLGIALPADKLAAIAT